MVTQKILCCRKPILNMNGLVNDSVYDVDRFLLSRKLIVGMQFYLIKDGSCGE